uniref:Uncharacterized protein n=1 Tax=Timema monikensis TaxID=170555 RepID=A0A7R9EBS5_9NEOP|nr:unnamed protein product [Timema monikensis]
MGWTGERRLNLKIIPSSLRIRITAGLNEYAGYVIPRSMERQRFSDRMSRGQMVLVLLVLWRTGGAKHTNTPNVGTSIFKEEDYIKSCWTLQDAALLNARRIMQDLIPRNSLDTRKDDFVPRLMSYFHSAAELIRARTRGPVQHSLLLALSDVIGGYLHVYVLPLARRGYYCGVVRWEHSRLKDVRANPVNRSSPGQFNLPGVGKVRFC